MKKGLFLLAALSLSGCAGQMVATNATMKFNMDVVDNRYARGGLTFLMSPVYALSTGADYIILNPIEFWTGTNIISKKPSIYDMEGADYIQINDKVGEPLKTAPIN